MLLVNQVKLAGVFEQGKHYLSIKSNVSNQIAAIYTTYMRDLIGH